MPAEPPRRASRIDLADLPTAADVVDDLADARGGLDVLVDNAAEANR